MGRVGRIGDDPLVRGRASLCGPALLLAVWRLYFHHHHHGVHRVAHVLPGDAAGLWPGRQLGVLVVHCFVRQGQDRPRRSLVAGKGQQGQRQQLLKITPKKIGSKKKKKKPKKKAKKKKKKKKKS